jgi:holliday junction DNA helicase RuvA
VPRWLEKETQCEERQSEEKQSEETQREGGTAVIGLLRGNVVLRSAEGEVIIDVSGVGYRVSVTPSTAVALMVGGSTNGTAKAGAGGAPATLFIHTHVREDAIVLYGFIHDDERRCFEVLLGSHGVGPSLALAIMAVLSPASLSTAVLEDDLDTLCTVPGVGRKTAARLLIELKSRLDLPDLSLDVPGPSGAGASRTSRAEARAALAELGYAPEEIRGALDGLRDDVGVEEMLRLALRELASR